jgi:hypothetical protein
MFPSAGQSARKSSYIHFVSRFKAGWLLKLILQVQSLVNTRSGNTDYKQGSATQCDNEQSKFILQCRFPWQPNIRSASQKISHLLSKLEIHYYVHNSPSVKFTCTCPVSLTSILILSFHLPDVFSHFASNLKPVFTSHLFHLFCMVCRYHPSVMWSVWWHLLKAWITSSS